MALKIVKGKCLPIGVDLGTSTVKAIQLRLAEENVELVAAGSSEIPPEKATDDRKRVDAQARLLREIVKSNEFRGRQAIVSIPAASTFVQHVKVPKATPDELPGLIVQELNGKLPFPVSQGVVRHVVAGDIYGDGEPQQEVIAVVASQATVNRYISLSRRAKLDVIGLNVEPCAIVECFARLFRRPGDADRNILFVDIGDASTQVVLSQGSRVVFARNLAMGGRMLETALSEAMGVPAGEARRRRLEAMMGKGEDSPDEIYQHLEPTLDSLAGELTQCLRYFESVFRNQSIERAIFLGGQAFDKRLCQSVARRLNVPAQIGDPLVRVKAASTAGNSTGLDRRQPQPNWAVAVGLSLGAANAA